MAIETCSSNGFSSIKPQPSWNTVYLIGGGPSLRGFDLQRLRACVTVAVNDAILHAPWATALFSLDMNWMNRRREQIEQFAGLRYLAIPAVHTDNLQLEWTSDEVLWLRRVSGVPGLSTSSDTIYAGGGNSGFGALNLAYLMQVPRIVLLGYDLRNSGQHWHEGYTWRGCSNEKMYQNWARMMDRAAPQLRARGVEVFNASPTSNLTEYPVVSLESIPLEEPSCAAAN